MFGYVLGHVWTFWDDLGYFGTFLDVSGCFDQKPKLAKVAKIEEKKCEKYYKVAKSSQRQPKVARVAKI